MQIGPNLGQEEPQLLRISIKLHAQWWCLMALSSCWCQSCGGACWVTPPGTGSIDDAAAEIQLCHCQLQWMQWLHQLLRLDMAGHQTGVSCTLRFSKIPHINLMVCFIIQSTWPCSPPISSSSSSSTSPILFFRWWLLRLPQIKVTLMGLSSQSSFLQMPRDYLGLSRSLQLSASLIYSIQSLPVCSLSRHCMHGPHDRGDVVSGLTTIADSA